MQLIDISGPIYTGMWSYEAPYPKVRIEPLSQPHWVNTPVYSSVISGLTSQTGTYLETAAHVNAKASCVDAISLRDLFMLDTIILKTPDKAQGRQPIRREELEASLGTRIIQAGTAIIVGTGWGRYWLEDFYLSDAPFFTLEAMRWLLSWSPHLIGADSPRWDNLKNPQGFWQELFGRETLVLAPVVNLEQVNVQCCKLIVLPLKLLSTSAAPARAVLVVDQFQKKRRNFEK